MVGFTVIKVELKNLNEILRAFKRVERALHREKSELPKRCAFDYRDLLSRNIMTQKFAGSYPPYNPRYKTWKEQYFSTTGFLVMRGTMVGNLSVYRGRFRTHWYSGLPKGLKVPGSSWFGPPGKGKMVNVSMYAHVNEFGGNWGYGYHPPRPVWIPTKEEYKKSKFQDRGKESLEILKRSWR